MSTHLSASQISRSIAGERSSDAACHLSECADCRSRIEEFQGTLAGFRRSVRGWSEAQYEVRKHPAWRRDSPAQSAQRPLYWALYWPAMAAAFCALMAVLVFHGSAPRHGTSGDGQSTAQSSLHSSSHTLTMDAALMRQVDTEVSQTVPDAMEPLMRLVSWDESTPAEGTSASKESATEKE